MLSVYLDINLTTSSGALFSKLNSMLINAVCLSSTNTRVEGEQRTA